MMRLLGRLAAKRLGRLLGRSWPDVATLAEHTRLAALAQELRPDLIDCLTIVPDRCALLRELPKHSVVAEIGVARGDFSERILSLNAPRELHLIDQWASDDDDSPYGLSAFEVVTSRFASEIEQGLVRLHRGLSWDAMAQFPDGLFDWVYIDASHSFDDVKRDLLVARAKVKAGGFVCGHDYTMWCGTPPSRAGVVEAVNEFCNVFDYEMLFLTHEANRHLSYAIRRRGLAGFGC